MEPSRPPLPPDDNPGAIRIDAPGADTQADTEAETKAPTDTAQAMPENGRVADAAGRPAHPRTIRSYVMRAGRTTAA